MKRAFAVLAVLTIIGAAAATAQDKFTWDPKKKRTPKAGTRYFSEEEQTQKAKVKITIPGQPEPQNQNQASKMTFRAVHDIQAVEGDKVTKETVTFEKWQGGAEGEDDDKSLEGKVVHVEVKEGKKTYKVDGGEDGLSEAAKAFLQKSFSKEKDEDEMDKFLPKEPISDGGEWNIDPKAFSEALLEGLDVDEKESSAKGKLTNVRVEDGVHFGTLEITIKMKLKKVPGTPLEWTEGGNFDLTMKGEACLEPEKSRKSSMKMDGRLKGKTEQADENMGKVEIRMDMTITAAQKEGDLPADGKTAPEPEKKDEKKPEGEKKKPM